MKTDTKEKIIEGCYKKHDAKYSSLHFSDNQIRKDFDMYVKDLAKEHASVILENNKLKKDIKGLEAQKLTLTKVDYNNEFDKEFFSKFPSLKDMHCIMDFDEDKVPTGVLGDYLYPQQAIFDNCVDVAKYIKLKSKLKSQHLKLQKQFQCHSCNSWRNKLIAEVEKVIKKVLKERIVCIDADYADYQIIDNEVIVSEKWIAKRILQQLNAESKSKEK